jgi:hypothetical protein
MGRNTVAPAGAVDREGNTARRTTTIRAVTSSRLAMVEALGYLPALIRESTASKTNTDRSLLFVIFV